MLVLVAVLGCNTAPPVPPACDQMCAAAAALYGGCLADWGVDWTAAGYDDEGAFIGACETWSWEMSLLSAHAEEEGLPGASAGWLTETCSARRDALSADDAACSEFTDIEWNDVQWSPDDTGQ